MLARKRLSGGLAALGAMVLVAAGTAVAVGHGDQEGRETAIRAGLSDQRPRNVIFLLGDGMGVQEVTAARYYQYGAAGRMNFDRLPLTGFDTTWSLSAGAGPKYLPDYVPDSAATGTEWATGHKTIDERISQGPSSAVEVPGANDGFHTVLERAQRQGKRVGNVSTAEITDATPAVLASHISLRGCQGPEDAAADCPKETKAAGGLGSIAEQEVDHGVDVILGGGRDRFEQKIDGGPYAGRTVVDSAADQGYRYVTDAAGLDRVRNVRRPVLGLFSKGNMSLEWSGPASSLGGGAPAVRCDTGKREASEPSLAAMTRKAIRLLKNRRGFFLQVEGASIDKQDHATNACGQIGETIAFDDAVGVALDYQREHPDTLVVVTADHAHTSEIVPEDAEGESLPTGYSTNLLTADGQTLRLTYGTSGYGGPGKPPVSEPPSQQHTGSVVPVWARGPRASRVLGTNDHTDLFDLLQGGR
jgi:alkaline phosphatase